MHLPGFIASGQATGTLTLTNAARNGSIALGLTGPTEPGFGPFPSFLSYVVTGGAGIYARAVGSGTVGVTLDMATRTFSFSIATFLPPV